MKYLHIYNGNVQQNPLGPFLTRKFFQEILGLEGSKLKFSWEKNPVSYEEIWEILARILPAEEILKPKISWRQEEILRGNFGIT